MFVKSIFSRWTESAGEAEKRASEVELWEFLSREQKKRFQYWNPLRYPNQLIRAKGGLITVNNKKQANQALEGWTI